MATALEEPNVYVDLMVDLFAPLIAAIENADEASRLLIELGYLPGASVTAFETLSPALTKLQDLIVALEQAAASSDDSKLEEALLDLLGLAVEVFRAVEAITAALQVNFGGSGLLTDTDILTAIVRKLVDYLVVRFLSDHHPVVHAALAIVGILELEEVSDTPTAFHAAYLKRTVRWDRIPAYFSDPLGTLKASLTDAQGLRYRSLIYFIYRLGLGLGYFTTFVRPDLAALSTFNDGHDLSAQIPPTSSDKLTEDADVTPLSDIGPLTSLNLPLTTDPAAALGLLLYPVVDPASLRYTGVGVGLRFGSELKIPLGDSLELSIKFSSTLTDSLGLRLDTDGKFTFINQLFTGNPQTLLDAIQFGAQVSVAPVPRPTHPPLISFGVPQGSRFEIGSGSLAVGIEKLRDLNLFVEADLRDGLIVLKSTDADGFLSKILPAEGITAGFSLGIGFSNQLGMYFKGSSALVIRLPLHLAIGPVNLDNLTIGLAFEKGRFPLTVATGISAKLGPLALAVEDVGVRATFEFKADRSGNAGPLDVSFAFKPPKGVGLSIDAGVVKGGGYLYFDFDREEYAGALELTISDFLSLKAIGLVTTRMPDGSKGFSLLIIITAEFNPGLQLGYGFKLIGVGGLLGLNRTVVLDALALGVRTGAVDGIMFPVDPVGNAPRIISDLRTIFPPFPNRFLIGPMAKLGWGTPTLISLSLGVIIEIPGNVAILGVLKAILPDEDAALLKLQVNFVGAIEFDKKRGWFFAALYESRIVFITLEGEMGMLIAVGADANFVLSVGGFHPRYTPPPLPFPSPKRLSFDIINTDVARIRAEGYFAVTTNSVQTGIRAELFFGFNVISVEGHMAFDALIRFSPFYLIVEISAGASLKAFGIGVFSIDLAFMLEGPTPWRARGRGSISLWFIEVSADFDVTWGEAQDTSLPPLAIIPMVQLEFGKAENWRALPPVGSNLLVTLRKLELPADALVLHPLGTLEVSQNAVPLGITLDKVGAQKPADANRFTVGPKAGGLVRRADARRGFAPAQFRDLNDAQKLAAPAFQSELSGLQLGIDGSERRCGRAVKRSLRYELTTIDTAYRRFVRRFKGLSDRLFGHFIRGAVVGTSALSVNQKGGLQPFADRIEISQDQYAVVFKTDNRAAAPESAAFESRLAAQEWMRSAAANDANLGMHLHVVPVTELSNAA